MFKLLALSIVVSAAAVVSVPGCTGDRLGPRTKERMLRLGEERGVFIGTVTKLERLGQHSATAYPVGPDPQFLLVVQVHSVERDSSAPIEAGRSISFGIHSPSLLFGSEDATGQRYRFRAIWAFGPENRKGFSWLAADSAAGPKKVDPLAPGRGGGGGGGRGRAPGGTSRVGRTFS